MRRADRLFQIIQILRRTRRPVTAQQIAGEVETSVRSVYRDIATLMAQRVPVRGEAGIGYVLERGFDMPPLMLTPDEIEAVALGAQLVAKRGDAVLAQAAEDVIAKIAATVPERLRPLLLDPVSSAPQFQQRRPDGIDMVRVRSAIRSGHKVRIRYRDEQDRETERTIWPIAVGYMELVRLLVAWCETRRDFRTFRTDRVHDAQFLEEAFEERPALLRARWRKTWEMPAARTAS